MGSKNAFSCTTQILRIRSKKGFQGTKPQTKNEQQNYVLRFVLKICFFVTYVFASGASFLRFVDQLFQLFWLSSLVLFGDLGFELHNENIPKTL